MAVRFYHVDVVKVLILIFLENALRPFECYTLGGVPIEVLILIFLENALRQQQRCMNFRVPYMS